MIQARWAVFWIAMAWALVACASQPTPKATAVTADDPATIANTTLLPTAVPQGSLVLGRTQPGSLVAMGAHQIRVAADGSFVLGIGRDATGAAVVSVRQPGAGTVDHRIAIQPRDWPIERIVGVPPDTVNPPPDIAARIEREQALVAAVRQRDDPREDYRQHFVWPVQGRISGRFGNQRIYVLPDGTEVPKSSHSGMDIAVPTGTPVHAPAAGIVTFAATDLYLTGGTLVLDHGHAVSSNFLHLSRIDVRLGDAVSQGQVIGAVGATGRATGPHLHWGMNWFDVRVDPLLVLERSGNPKEP